MKYEIHIEAHTPVGVFEGRCHLEPTEHLDELKQLRDTMQKRGLRTLVLYTPSASGTMKEVSLAEDMLNRSVLVYDLRPAHA